MKVQIEKLNPQRFRITRGGRVCCEGTRDGDFCDDCRRDMSRVVEMESAAAWSRHLLSALPPPDLIGSIRAARGLKSPPSISGGVASPPDLVAIIQAERRRS
jgi:hypothetical protein